MGSIYVTLAIPVFFLLIFLEAYYSRKKKKGLYDLTDSVSNIGTGVIAQILTGATRAIGTFSLYSWIYQNYSLFHFNSENNFVFWVGLITADFLYYWWHRMSHEINLFWFAHVIHHQSDRYNLSVALRQNWLTEITNALFYAPLAFLGFSPALFLTLGAVLLLYQFWIHTEVIGKMGIFESVFNTPSHHRVHHGINPKYVDRNYGGILIIWDKIFGTFAEENEKPIYGILKPRRTWSSVLDYLSPWKELRFSSCRSFFVSMFCAPGWEGGQRPDIKGSFLERKKEGLRCTSPQFNKKNTMLAFFLISMTIGLVPLLSQSLYWALGCSGIALAGLVKVGQLCDAQSPASEIKKAK